MIDLGSTDFLLPVPSLPEPELEQRSSSLFDSWESFVESSLSIPDYSLFLQIEEGSIKGVTRIGAFLSVVYFGIGTYGSFVSGLKTINDQLSATREYLVKNAGNVFACPDSRVSTRKRGGSLASLQRLFVKVQTGDLTPDEAFAQAKTLLGEEFVTLPGFQRDLENSLRNCSRFPRQLALPLGELGEDDLHEFDKPNRPVQPRRPQPPLGPAFQFRVEVWRESKNKHKQTRVVRL